MRKFINPSTSDINEMYQKDFKKIFSTFFSHYIRVFRIQSTKDALHVTFVNTSYWFNRNVRNKATGSRTGNIAVLKHFCHQFTTI